MKLDDIETPALVVDLDRTERNISRVAEYAAGHGLALRPHTKTHKTPQIGRLQLDAGARGLTVAKVGEAEVMTAAEPPELLIAYPVIGDNKCARLADVAKQTDVLVGVDSLQSAEGLSAAARRAGVTFGILVEADVGMHRCGLPPGPELVRLAQQVATLPGLALRGVEFYPGHIWPAGEEGEAQLRALAADVERIRGDFIRAGLSLEIVSGGSSPTLYRSHEIPGVTEIRPGTCVFNDRMQVAAGVASWEDCAATLLVTVVSTPRENFAVIDGGSKTFTSDPVRPTGEMTYGRVIEAPEARFYKMNEEHGFVDIDKPVRIGERLRVIPNHVCVAVNMHEKMYAVRGDQVEAVWDVAGRGKLQ